MKSPERSLTEYVTNRICCFRHVCGMDDKRNVHPWKNFSVCCFIVERSLVGVDACYWVLLGKYFTPEEVRCFKTWNVLRRSSLAKLINTEAYNLSEKYKKAAGNFFDPMRLYRFETEAEIADHFKRTVRIPSISLTKERKKKLRNLLDSLLKTRVLNVTSWTSKAKRKYWAFNLEGSNVKLDKKYQDFTMREYLASLCGYSVFNAKVIRTSPHVTIAGESLGVFRPSVSAEITLTSLVTANVHTTVKTPAFIT